MSLSGAQPLFIVRCYHYELKTNDYGGKRFLRIRREPTRSVVLSGVRLCRTQSKDLAFAYPNRSPEGLHIPL